MTSPATATDLAGTLCKAELETGLLRGHAACLDVILRFAIGCTSGRIFLSVESIANAARYKPRWMRYGFAALEAAGLLERVARSGRTNLYELRGRAALYVRQQRDAKAASAAARTKATLDYISRAVRAASGLNTPALDAARISFHKKEIKSARSLDASASAFGDWKLQHGFAGSNLSAAELWQLAAKDRYRR